MMIREAMQVFWRSLKDAWEEMLPLALVNLVWVATWGGPFALIPSSPAPWLTYSLLALGLALGAVSTGGLYHVADRVAHGKTAHFEDWREGLILHWRKALLWLLVNVLVVLAVVWNIAFYGENIQGNWVWLLQAVWFALALFWAMMQVYFWPVLLQLEEPRLVMAWRFSAMLIVANPFYAFFVGTSTLLVAIVSVATGVVLGLFGGTAMALLASNAVLTLLFKLGKIADPRPEFT